MAEAERGDWEILYVPSFFLTQTLQSSLYALSRTTPGSDVAVRVSCVLRRTPTTYGTGASRKSNIVSGNTGNTNELHFSGRNMLCESATTIALFDE